ncbi:sugar ABC transporter permease [Jonesiaceae bacterium BS-20]|uniref:Sugar ABC transporter permease n=1 Tax=Jonesiaceae bacterium BS-20 TaxID=3120821 RepID=A0AAU7DUR5_9MICO
MSVTERRKPGRLFKSKPPLWTVLALIPGLAVVIVFCYYPLARTVLLSVQGSDLFGRPTGLIGLENYREMFADSDFWATLLRTLIFTLGSVVGKIAVGLALAIPLAQRVRGTVFARSIVLIPMAVSVAVAGLAFRALMTPQYGLLDQVLAVFGAGPAGWLTDSKMAMVSVILVDVWTAIGFVTLLLITALDSIDESVNEAASLDGATALRKLRNITIPLITPTLFFVVVTQSIQAMREFAVINVVTGGGPARGTHTLVFDIYTKAFGGSADYGGASARGIILLLIIGLLSAVQFGVLEKKVNY